jgi:hypothetical protein
MNRTSAITTAVVMSFSLLGGSAAWAADPAEPAPAKQEVTAPAKPDELLKTKTKSNQSNDREAAPAPTKDKDTVATDPVTTEQPAELLKTKTKSNQSND